MLLLRSCNYLNLVPSLRPSPHLDRSLMADQNHCPLCKGCLRRGGVWCHTCYKYFHVKCSCKSCSEVTAATETAIATPAPHNVLTVPDTPLIDLATSHAHENAVATSDNFWNNFLALSRGNSALNISRCRHIEALVLHAQQEQDKGAVRRNPSRVLAPIAVNTDRSDISPNPCLIRPLSILSRKENTDNGSNNKTIKRRLRAWHSCNFSELFCEAKAIQMRLNSRNKAL